MDADTHISDVSQQGLFYFPFPKQSLTFEQILIVKSTWFQVELKTSMVSEVLTFDLSRLLQQQIWVVVVLLSWRKWAFVRLALYRL